MKKILITCCLLLATCSLFAQYQEIQNGESGYSTRTKLNTMFQQLFARTAAVGDSIELYLPEFLTDLDSMGFSLDTMQVRHLKEAIEAWSINEFQVLSINGDTIFLSNGNYVVLPADGISPEDTTGLYHSNRTVLDATTASFTTAAQSNYNSAVSHISADHDTSATNELQILSFSGDTLYLLNGGYVYLGAYANPSLTAYLRKEDSALYAPLFRLDTVKANIRSEIPDVSGFLETETDPVFALYPKIPKDSTLILLKADSALYKSKWSADKQLADSAATLRALVPLNPVLGSGTANFIPKFSASNTLADSPIRLTADSVGIGISPTAKLHVATNSAIEAVKIENSNTTDGDGLTITVGGSGSSSVPLKVRRYDTTQLMSLNGTGKVSFPRYGSGTITGTEAFNLSVDANGNFIETTPVTGGSIPLTTKGDLVGYSTSVGRYGVGTNGQVLTANSAATFGFEWQTPSSSVWSYMAGAGYTTASNYFLALLNTQGITTWNNFGNTQEIAFAKSGSKWYWYWGGSQLGWLSDGSLDILGNNFKAVKTGTAKNDSIPTVGWVEDKISSSGGGDMLKSTYDSDNDTRVDNAETVSDGTNVTSAANVKTAYDDRNKWDGGSTGLTAATGRTSLGATTVGSNLFTLTNPSAIRFLRINADNTVSALSDIDFRTAIGAGSGSMTYPSGSGIPIVSGGNTWGTTITDNSTNWNTAYTDRLKWDGGSTGLTAATGRTSLGGTTIGQAMFTSTNPGAITFGRANADNTFSWLSASDYRTAIGATTAAWNASKLQDFDLDTTDPTDGKIWVYRTASSKFVLEDKPVSSGSPAWGEITGTISSQTDLDSILTTKQDTLHGNESVFTGWDKNASDDFSGAYSSLTGKPDSIFDFLGINRAGWVEGKVVKFNAAGDLVVGTDNVGESGGIALTDISATSPLAYNNTTGVFSVNASYAIPTTTEKSNFNTSYGWGNWASNFGTATGTIAQGNDSRITNGQTAYGWGNWASNFGTATGTIAQGNDSRITNGQTAYGWGNHASAGYLTGNQTMTFGSDVSGSGTTIIDLYLGNSVVDSAHMNKTEIVPFIRAWQNNPNLSYTASTRAVAISNGTGFTLPLFSTSSTDAGLVPGGTSISTKFLRGDGTWQDVSGGGQWQTLSGAIAQTTLTDEVRVGSVDDFGSYIFGVSGATKLAGNTDLNGNLTFTSGKYISLYEMSAPGAPGATAGLLYMDSSNDKLYYKNSANTYDLTSGGTNYWQALTGAIAPATIGDEVRIGSTTDFGDYKLQVNGNTAVNGNIDAGIIKSFGAAPGFIVNRSTGSPSVSSTYAAGEAGEIRLSYANDVVGGSPSVSYYPFIFTGTYNQIDGPRTELNSDSTIVNGLLLHNNGSATYIANDNHKTQTLSTGTQTLNWNYGADGIISSLTANSTVNVHNVPDGKSGTIMIINDASPGETFAINVYSDAGSTALTQKIMGAYNGISTTASKATTITYKRFGSYVTIIYGREY